MSTDDIVWDSWFSRLRHRSSMVEITEEAMKNTVTCDGSHNLRRIVKNKITTINSRSNHQIEYKLAAYRFFCSIQFNLFRVR